MHKHLRIAPLAVAAASLLAAFPSAAPATKNKPLCTKVVGDTLYRDQQWRVFQTIKQSKKDPDASTVTIKYCRSGSRAKPKQFTTLFNNLDGSMSVVRATRGGDNIALELDEQTGAADATDLFVYSFSSRARTFAYGSESPFDYYVTSGGGVAILEAGKLTGYDASGEHVLAAAGAASLAGSENTIYWTANGAAQTASLTGAASRQF